MGVQVCAIHGSKYQLPYLVKSIVSYTRSFMLTVQQLVFVFTEVAAIVFGCDPFSLPFQIPAYEYTHKPRLLSVFLVSRIVFKRAFL